MAAFSTIATVAGLALSAGGLAYGIATKPKAPKPRSIADEASSTLTAQERNLTRQTALDRAQAFNALGTQRDLLLGGQAGNTTIWTDKAGKPLDPEWQTYLNDALSTDRDALAKQYGFQRREQTGARQPGIISLYNEALKIGGPMLAARVAESNPLEGSLYQTASRELAQGGGPLDRVIEQDALEQLTNGATLDPRERRLLEQSTRSASAARGLGNGPGDAAMESLAVLAGGQGLRQDRQRYALAAAGNARVARGQAQSLASLASGTRYNQQMAPLLNSLGLAAGQQQAAQFNPYNAYAADVNNTNYNAAAAAGIARSNNAQSLAGGLVQGGFQLASAFQPGAAAAPTSLYQTSLANAATYAPGRYLPAYQPPQPNLSYSLF